MEFVLNPSFRFCRTYCLAVVELNLENRIFGRIDKLHLNVTLVENMNNNSKMRPTGIKSNQINELIFNKRFKKMALFVGGDVKNGVHNGSKCTEFHFCHNTRKPTYINFTNKQTID